MHPLYTAALGSEKSGCHFHAHMVPLYKATPPNSVTGTPFDVERRTVERDFSEGW